jgi:Cys-tRNA(Pro)/Cys-tRNA(Cys) deacylase
MRGFRHGISFTVLEYEHDAASESYGLEAAERLGLDPARVFKTLLDDGAFEHETIFVSAGRHGLELELAPGDLAVLTGADTAALARR